MLGSGKYASSTGQCASFGDGGDGYVPGEGVGAVLLKPLDRAIADGDIIHGVVKATAVNHGGKTNGYSVPNPAAQHSVIGHALRDAGVDARSVSYVEAHGTGTSLGDPIEIAGLTKAFREHTADSGFCAIGSVKSNIGHCESAAGISALTKVLLQLRFGTLVPSLHSEVLNPHIDFEGSPFRVQRELAEWTRPVSADGVELLRIAGVSSFGAGGSNAHVIIEEYLPAAAPPRPAAGPAVVVLSATTSDALTRQVERLLGWVEQHGCDDAALADLAYTLQTGRGAYEERLGFVVATPEDLARTLRAILAGGDIPGLHRGQARRRVDAPPVLTADEDIAAAIAAWFAKGKYDKLLDLWVGGGTLDWSALHGDPAPRRISLPAYPFAGERYWIPGGPAPETTGAARLHPLLHNNTSSLSEQRFTSVYTGAEFFLADHRVRGERVLSGAACLELVRAAVDASLDGPHGDPVLCDVVWARPVTVGGEPVEVHVRLLPDERGDIAFEVVGTEHEHEIVYSAGVARVPAESAEPARLDVPGLRTACDRRELAAAECYAAFGANGIDYGPGHRGVERVWIGDGQVIARLVLPTAVQDTLDDYGLHPSLLDAALQSCLGLVTGDGPLLLPYAVEEVRTHGPCTDRMWAWVRDRAGSPTDAVRRFDIDLCDDDGLVRVQIIGVAARAAEPTTAELLASPQWVAAEPVPAGESLPGPTLVVALPAVADALRARGVAGVELLDSAADGLADRYTDLALRVFTEVRTVLRERDRQPVRIQLVAPVDPSAWAGLGAVLDSAALENPRLRGQVVLVDAERDPALVAADVVAERAATDTLVRHRDGVREVQRWHEHPPTAAPTTAWKDGGTYLITGGAGGLGALFAREIATAVREPRLVLTGRAPLDATKDALLTELRELGAHASYAAVDVSDRAAVDALVARIRAEHGRLDGILHSAGILRDSFVLKKSEEDFAAVLAPKVAGLVNLDDATREDELDFVVAFSSVAGVLGNVGQSDYAAANAFMDAYAHHRNAMVAAGTRHGHTVSVDWPLWSGGGMSVDQDTERSLRETLGLIPLPEAAGVAALHRTLASGHGQVLVLAGDKARLRTSLLAGLLAEPVAAPTPVASVPAIAVDSTDADAGRDIADKAAAYFTRLLASVIRLPAARIDAEAPFDAYGIDSVMTMDLTRGLEEVFGTLPKTLFFEHQSIRALTRHFLDAYPAKMRELLPTTATPPSAPVVAAPTRLAVRRTVSAAARGPVSTDVAIIGLAGRYPGARDVDEFWANLVAGKDCVTEIPADRWDHGRYFDADKGGARQDLQQVGRFPRRRLRVRPAVLRDLPARSRDHGPAGAAVPAVRARHDRRRRTRPGRRARQPGGRVRRRDVRGVPALRRAGAARGRAAGAGGQPGVDRQPGVVLLRLPRAEPERGHDVLVLAHLDPPGVPQPRVGRLRRGGRRWGEPVAAPEQVPACSGRAGSCPASVVVRASAPVATVTCPARVWALSCSSRWTGRSPTATGSTAWSREPP